MNMALVMKCVMTETSLIRLYGNATQVILMVIYINNKSTSVIKLGVTYLCI